MCRPENSPTDPHHSGAAAIPLWILLSFAAAIAVFVRRFFQTRKPVEPGFAWSVVAVFLWLQFAPVGKMSDAYVATAALILAASLIETSYVLAYHDELTGYSRTPRLQRVLALARPAIRHRHSRHRPFQEIQRHLWTRRWGPGVVHGSGAVIRSRWRRPSFPLRWRGVRHSLSQHFR